MKTLEILQSIGIAPTSAEIYLLLLEQGPQTARQIMESANLVRPTVYHALKDLEREHLVSVIEGGPRQIFRALSPAVLLAKSEVQLAAQQSTHQALSGQVPQLLAQFMESTQQSTMQTFSSLEGLKFVYKDILNTGKDIRLVQSPYDDKHPVRADVIRRQIESQVAAGIATRAITPLQETTVEYVHSHDAKNLVTRVVVDGNQLDFPAQVLLYGNTLALTSFTEEVLMTTVIKNNTFVQTFSLMFEDMWSRWKPASDQVIDAIWSGQEYASLGPLLRKVDP